MGALGGPLQGDEGAEHHGGRDQPSIPRWGSRDLIVDTTVIPSAQPGQGQEGNPAGQETAPVGYVDYREAESYARWAGVRLQTEFEFQRAGRGDTKNTYP
ncbi:MAG TPA: SUMF1/EgtB/PvdO family nonheme iron enzyme, partial [Phycicoccus sp.]|nr:SUMF1/EgtB/PvdO family nonheme iron enzyme [Phycicoccus sp.]